MRYYNCNGFIYEVQPGDTLYSISRQFNVPIGWIINANREFDIYNLFVGLQICIPDRNPNINIIPIVPVRPWPGNFGGPGPVIIPPRPRPRPWPGPGPRPQPGPGPRRFGNNPFASVAFGEEEYSDNEYLEYEDELEITDTSSENNTPYVIISYVVKNDDNLSSILERFGISMQDVLRYNDMVEIYLKPGTVLKVPNRNAMDEQKYEPSLS